MAPRGDPDGQTYPLIRTRLLGFLEMVKVKLTAIGDLQMVAHIVAFREQCPNASILATRDQPERQEPPQLGLKCLGLLEREWLARCELLQVRQLVFRDKVL